MNKIESRISGVLLLQNEIFEDVRGTFEETYSRQNFETLGIDTCFVQDNRSNSLRINTLRGLHFQKPPFDQAKLIRCEKGSIFDVAVDLRLGSKTYGAWEGFELQGGDGKQIFIPSGFAHGFLTLEEQTVVTYKCSSYYNPGSEMSLIWNDEDIGIDWPITNAPILSEKDARAPMFGDFQSPFVIGD